MNLIDQIQQRLLKAFPDAETNLNDYKHDGVHVIIEIKSSAFKNLSLVHQHQLVYKALTDLLNSGELHAIKLKTVSK